MILRLGSRIISYIYLPHSPRGYEKDGVLSMFHLIGVAHRVQSKKKGEELSAEQKEYVAHLMDSIKAVKPALVAEEFSDHALQKLSKDNGAEFESITRPEAESRGVKYRGCDPDDAARKKIG